MTSGNPQNGGPKLSEQRYHYKGSCYVTAGLLQLVFRLGLETLETLTRTLILTLIVVT